MTLKQLHIHSLRNIALLRLDLHPRYNVFIGANGSGKTSLLEAIYLLGTGHSFRTREISPLINYAQSKLTVFARTVNEETVSILKSVSGPTLVKLNQQPCKSNSELARFLPCQVFYQDIFQIIDSGPSIRRSLLDWGLFHVEQRYHLLWRDYKRVLKQRNALLRQKPTYQQCVPWDEQLVGLSEQLHQLRNQYFSVWSQDFQTLLAQLSDIPCSIEYQKGWDKKNTGVSLATILVNQFESDCLRQYTQSGAHQADIIFNNPHFAKVKQTFSRGQQKIILIALKLAQAQLLGKSCIYLMDDLMAELDDIHAQRLFRCLQTIPGQFFLTATSKDLISAGAALQDFLCFSLNDGKVFHVEQ
ncbi:DNA replication/repair protein RecF [Legionella sp. 27cVA30]|uniref:DNA replication/repair protein RecF n=1 Tax=Legionella sp. 27cVA30 TaxID=2905657 RepID=UPI0020A1AF72|nr:DNA replication/repair protein RecF [Legionella sp. 27cVA30]MCP0914832.1 DNA replication/repair protein RecF [Legionella sp. 27cVA30]